MNNNITLKAEFKELLKTYPDIERKASDIINCDGEIMSDYYRLQNAFTKFVDKVWLCNSMFDVKIVGKEEYKISSCSPLSFLLNEHTLTDEYWEKFQTACRDQIDDNSTYVYFSPTIEDEEQEFRIPKDVIQKIIKVCTDD
jgi:hypothetical protein